MKYFLISYRRTAGNAEDWQRQVGEFIAAVDADPELRGRVRYRSMRERDGDRYFNLATVADDAAQKLLQDRPFFRKYSAATKAIAVDNLVEAIPMEIIAETKG